MITFIVSKAADGYKGKLTFKGLQASYIAKYKLYICVLLHSVQNIQLLSFWQEIYKQRWTLKIF